MYLFLMASSQIQALKFACRLDSVKVVIQSGLEDPLDKDEELQDQMENLPYLCRFQYEESCKYICGLMDPIVDAFSKCRDPCLSLPCDYLKDKGVHSAKVLTPSRWAYNS